MTYRYRLACDARYPAGRAVYERFWKRKGQSDRVRQAETCWRGGLIADRCTFGRRRLILEGEVDAATSMAAQELALLVAQWTLYTMYGQAEFGDVGRAPEPPGLDVRVRELRP